MPIDEEEPVARLHQAEMTIGEEYGDDDADEEEQEIPAQSKKEVSPGPCAHRKGRHVRCLFSHSRIK